MQNDFKSCRNGHFQLSMSPLYLLHASAGFHDFCCFCSDWPIGSQTPVLPARVELNFDVT